MVSEEPRFELSGADSESVPKPDSWGPKMLVMNRRLIVIAGCGVLLIVALVISLAVVAKKSYDGSPDAKCLTPGCTIEAARVLQALNQTVKPCDDFYEFACGGFKASTMTPGEDVEYSINSIVEEKLEEKLRLSIEGPSSPDELKTFRLAKDLYRSCMNSSANDESALQKQTLLKVLKDLGGWPVLEGDNWTGDTFIWFESIQKCWKLGYTGGYLIDFYSDTDVKNNTKRILQVDQATPILSRWTDKETNKTYFKSMLDHAVGLGANLTTAIRQLNQSLLFEKKLISWSEAKRMNLSALYNPMPISELNKRYPIMDWERMFNGILPPSVRVGTDDIVNARVPSYLRDFAKIIASTPKRTVANYILWKVVQSSYPDLTEELGQGSRNERAEGTQFIGTMSDLESDEAEWEKCVRIVAERMPIGMGALHVRNHFSRDAKKKVTKIFSGLQIELKELFKQAEWMDKKTRRSALEKVASMQTHIAYPDEFFDDKKLEEYYANLELRPDNLLKNILNLEIFEANYRFGLLRKPLNRTDWIEPNSLPLDANAYYIPERNSIIIPAGALQGSFFSIHHPQYMNYGATGFTVGHEISHGFDNDGIDFDKEGNLFDWWNPETKKQYEKKTECLVYQYGNYTAKSVNLTLDGSQTLAENIADNVGIKLAYLAYKKLVKTNGAEPKLPGLIEYTPEQMFWISAANSWCTKYRARYLKTLIKTDGHSPARFRVIGPFSNSPEFSADFNCPLGSRMNPVDKCSVW